MLYPDIWDWSKGDGRYIDVKKKLIKFGLHHMAKKYREKFLPRKLKEGFINQEAEVIYRVWERFIEFYEESYTNDPREKYPHELDPRYQMHRDLQAIQTVMTDQDTHYLVESVVWLSMMVATWPQMTLRTRAMFARNKDWEKFKALLLRGLEMEMQPLEDVTVDVGKIEGKETDEHEGKVL